VQLRCAVTPRDLAAAAACPLRLWTLDPASRDAVVAKLREFEKGTCVGRWQKLHRGASSSNSSSSAFVATAASSDAAASSAATSSAAASAAAASASAASSSSSAPSSASSPRVSPSARAEAASCSDGRTGYIFGGFGVESRGMAGGAEGGAAALAHDLARATLKETGFNNLWRSMLHVIFNDVWALHDDAPDCGGGGAGGGPSGSGAGAARGIWWERLECTGEAPAPVHKAAACVLDGVMYVHGGEHDAIGSDLSAELHALDLASRCWRKVSTSPAFGGGPVHVESS
jgi:hypothetical protein